MRRVRPASPHLAELSAYDPKYLPARDLLSANENPLDVEEALRRKIAEAVKRVSLNRYPDPLSNGLRDAIARANGLSRDQVLVGNGGDELLFDVALAWGGPGRTFLNVPPTFSVYAANARLTHTRTVEVPRLPDFSLDEDAVCERAAAGDVDFVIVTSPNNPTGNLAPRAFVERLLGCTDALVLVDEAYFEFAGRTALPLLSDYENLVVLRTFSKAYSLAGVRVGYLLGHASVIRELAKVRQPYSVDALAQAAAQVVFEERERFAPGIRAIVAERGRLLGELGAMEGVEAFPSDANFILLRTADAGRVWERLYDQGVLVRDFSAAPGLSGCLRVTVGTRRENDELLRALRDAVAQTRGEEER